MDGREFIASIYLKQKGIVCGVGYARDTLAALGCTLLHAAYDGDVVAVTDPILVFSGSAKEIALAEDVVIGCIAKATGIARAANSAVCLAREHSGGRVRIVSGASKKMPAEIKTQVRHAVHVGGVTGRMVEGPFLYLDKNYVRMFGSVAATLDGVLHIANHTRVIQLRGFLESLENEARAALERDAEILMVDTGQICDVDTVSRLARELNKRSRVLIAFAGDVRHEHIPELCGYDIDLIDMGAAIVDAPMADCSFDVVQQTTVCASDDSLELHLLQKTELRIDGITLHEANLTDIATEVAACLSLPGDKVAVIDVRPAQLALDVLIPTIRADQIFGKEKSLLRALEALPGISLSEKAEVHSEGILGAISLDEKAVPEILARTRNMHASLKSRKRGRVKVFPTGFELIERRIEDTNTPYLMKLFSQAGFVVEAGDILPDSKEAMVAALAAAAEDCSLVVSTGGVGAEDKDFSVEAVLSVDPFAVAPYLVRFAKGEGRHVKDGVRIAVGEKNGCLLVALPGPHDEVKLIAPVLIRGMKEGRNLYDLAEELASSLREKLRGSAAQHGHRGSHAVTIM
ncbi:MAG: hypothetical protein LBR94_03355 [Desulfovibrio sp.]|nr:hypothetical protein [Desulfovibrio sp.]